MFSERPAMPIDEPGLPREMTRRRAMMPTRAASIGTTISPPASFAADEHAKLRQAMPCAYLLQGMMTMFVDAAKIRCHNICDAAKSRLQASQQLYRAYHLNKYMARLAGRLLLILLPIYSRRLYYGRYALRED